MNAETGRVIKDPTKVKSEFNPISKHLNWHIDPAIAFKKRLELTQPNLFQKTQKIIKAPFTKSKKSKPQWTKVDPHKFFPENSSNTIDGEFNHKNPILEHMAASKTNLSHKNDSGGDDVTNSGYAFVNGCHVKLAKKNKASGGSSRGFHVPRKLTMTKQGSVKKFFDSGIEESGMSTSRMKSMTMSKEFSRTDLMNSKGFGQSLERDLSHEGSGASLNILEHYRSRLGHSSRVPSRYGSPQKTEAGGREHGVVNDVQIAQLTDLEREMFIANHLAAPRNIRSMNNDVVRSTINQAFGYQRKKSGWQRYVDAMKPNKTTKKGGR